MTEFPAFSKIPRLQRNIVVTEKIDGTNALVHIEPADGRSADNTVAWTGGYLIRAGSRTRWITPEDDNYGFARWVKDNAEELAKLGPGTHHGEWWGRGIQRNYGLDHRRFSLFNAGRWVDSHGQTVDVLQTLGILDKEVAPGCCHVVPLLWEGPYIKFDASYIIACLSMKGSTAARGFMDPEGIVVYHEASGHLYKQTCKHDDEPKNAHPKKERLPQEHKPKSAGGRRKADDPNYWANAGIERRIR